MGEHYYDVADREGRCRRGVYERPGVYEAPEWNRHVRVEWGRLHRGRKLRRNGERSRGERKYRDGMRITNCGDGHRGRGYDPVPTNRFRSDDDNHLYGHTDGNR